MLRRASFLALWLVLVAGCAANRPPEETTDDGLVRVPSRNVGGVYRLPGASFVQYRSIIIEPPSISFIARWAENHPEVGKKELTRILNEVIEIFREEFARELVERGPYKFAEDLGPEVLLVNPAIEDLDIPAVVEPGTRGFAVESLSMTISGDMRDAATGALVGRVILIQPRETWGEGHLHEANRATNAREMRQVCAKWARLVHEALNLAKAERPRKPVARPDTSTTEAPR